MHTFLWFVNQAYFSQISEVATLIGQQNDKGARNQTITNSLLVVLFFAKDTPDSHRVSS